MVMAERPPPLHVVAEVARLAALRSYHVLDTPPAAGFDLFARDAAACMQRPMAAVSLVDRERLWFKSAVGMGWAQAPRHASFCHHAIAQPGPLIVPDAMADSRFRDHPDVQGGPRLRFYAGVSLEDEDGYRLGTICAFDQVPGPAAPVALSGLATLAAQVVAALSAHRDALAALPAGIGQPAAPVQGWLGVRTARTERLHDGSKPGLIVVSVASDSPADRAGIRPTDILVAIDGLALRHSSDVTNALSSRPTDGLARLQLLRGGRALERVLPIEAEPKAMAAARPPPQP